MKLIKNSNKLSNFFGSMQKFSYKLVCTSLMLRSSMSIRESSLSWSGVMVVEVTGRASCLGGTAAVHTSLTCQTGFDNK